LLVSLYNAIFTTGVIPETWPKGYIIPFHNKGPASDVALEVLHYCCNVYKSP